MNAQVFVRRARAKDTKMLICLDGASSNCLGVFRTTIEVRICQHCAYNARRDQTEAQSTEAEDSLMRFWKGLK